MNLLSRLLLAASVVAVATPAALAQAGAGKKTAWGAPDLQGFWTNISLTAMQRPATTDKLVLSDEEAARLVGHNTYTNVYKQEAGVSKLDQAATDKLLGDKNANRGYNAFWIDPGKNYAKVKGENRSSWITFPANGRIPYSEAGIAANTPVVLDFAAPKDLAVAAHRRFKLRFRKRLPCFIHEEQIAPDALVG